MDSKKIILETITEYLSSILVEHNIEKAASFLAPEMICYDLDRAELISTKEQVLLHLQEKIKRSNSFTSFHIENSVINLYDNMAVFHGKIVIERNGVTTSGSIQHSVTLHYQNGWKLCSSHYSVHESFENESWGFSAQNMAGGILSCYLENDRFPLRFINENLLKLMGYTQEEAKSKFGENMLEIVHPDDRKKVGDEVLSCIAQGKDWKLNHRIFTKDGQILHMLVRGKKSQDALGREIITNFSIDMTDLYQLQEQVAIQAEELEAQNEELIAQTQELTLQHEELECQNEELIAQSNELAEHTEKLILSEKKFRIALAKTNHIIFDYNIKEELFHYYNLNDETMDRIIHSSEVATKLIENESIVPEDMTLFDFMISQIKNGDLSVKKEIRTFTLAGEYKWYQFLLTSIFDAQGRPVYAIGTAEDITGQKKNELDLRYKAEYDLLTSVYNKISAMEKIEEKLSGKESLTSGAFMILDVDCFKTINDVYGHPYGDKVLKDIALTLKNNFRETDIIGRMGGDEFCIYIDGTHNIHLIKQKAENINQEIRCLLHPGGTSNKLTVSIGITTCNGIQKSFEQVYKEADQALYSAKQKGKDAYCFYKNI